MNAAVESRKIKKALVTCHSLKILSGSELVTLDIANNLKMLGIETVCASFVTGDPINQLFASRGIPVINLIENPQLMLDQSFDLVWAHHWPVVGFCLTELQVRYRYLVASSLSAFEPLEAISIIQPIADVVVCNSQSTKAAHAEEIFSVDIGKLHVMNNSLNDEWFLDSGGGKPDTTLKRLAVVSNHVPAEMLEAVEQLRGAGVNVTLIGMETSQCLVDWELTRSFDAVVTIGHSVQKCLAAGVPVYCYDRFGGPGWISQKNLYKAEVHNFSGRCCHRCLSGQALAREVLDGFKDALARCSENQVVAKDRYRLATNIVPVLDSLDADAPFRRVTPISNTLRKLTQMYLREKFNINIPAVVNIQSGSKITEQKLFRLAYVSAEKNVWSGSLAYLGVNPIPGVLYSSMAGLAIGGVALSADSTNPVIEVALFASGTKFAIAALSRPSPGVGKHFPEVRSSEASGFLISLSGRLDSRVYQLVVTLQQGQGLQVGQLEITRLSGLGEQM